MKSGIQMGAAFFIICRKQEVVIIKENKAY